MTERDRSIAERAELWYDGLAASAVPRKHSQEVASAVRLTDFLGSQWELPAA
jgi:hypothetical protein